MLLFRVEIQSGKLVFIVAAAAKVGILAEPKPGADGL
jgi:hypothetical protein